MVVTESEPPGTRTRDQPAARPVAAGRWGASLKTDLRAGALRADGARGVGPEQRLRRVELARLGGNEASDEGVGRGGEVDHLRVCTQCRVV